MLENIILNLEEFVFVVIVIELVILISLIVMQVITFCYLKKHDRKEKKAGDNFEKSHKEI